MRTDKASLPVRKNMDIGLHITSLTSDGAGVGRFEGFTVMVPGTLPGEEVQVHVIKVQKNYAIGKLTSIDQASPERTTPDCSVYGRCGGCQWMHLAYDKQLDLKREQVVSCLRRIGHISEEELPDEKILPVLGMEDWHHYRNKAQFPVKMIDGEIRYGFYAPHSHRLIPCETCLIQSRRAGELMPRLMETAKRLGLSIYDEESHQGLLRHVLIRDDVVTGESSVCFVINGNRLPRTEEWIEAVKALGINSFSININRDASNVILGRETRILYGEDHMTAVIGDLRFHVSPVSFFQVNSSQVEVLYDQVKELIEPSGDDVLWDAYCGAGTIGLYLASSVRRVYGVEVVPEAVENARDNAALNGITNAEFFTGKAEEVMPAMIREGCQAGKVVVDPPRSGCDRQLLDAICEMSPEKIVYVSCEPSTLARDLRILLDAGKGYRISKVQPVDMFPATGHVETVVLMTRNR